MPYKTWLPSLAPASLHGTKWMTFLGAIADEMDALTARLKDSVKTKWPGFGALDAMLALGGDRGMPRGSPYSGGISTETLEEYSYRLRLAWTAWAKAGSAHGLLLALHAAGYTKAKVAIFHGRLYSLGTGQSLVIEELPAGSWLTDAGLGWWSACEVLFFAGNLPTTPKAPSDWSTPPAPDSEEIRALWKLLDQWLPAYCRCTAIKVLQTGPYFGWPTDQVFTVSGSVVGETSVVTTYSPPAS